MVSGLSTQDDKVQVNTLIYSMGDEADDILRSLTLSTEDFKKYNVVKEKFEQRRNVIFEQAKFNMRRQEEGELVDTFKFHIESDHKPLIPLFSSKHLEELSP